ncbi:MAG: hypothetical protein K2X27_09915 [Candidatus Obscuribacterales bacterium]|nr:hypothetical protein [Candidatus Obscuribacterales bacterium]
MLIRVLAICLLAGSLAFPGGAIAAQSAGQTQTQSSSKSPLKASAKATDVEAAEQLRQMGDCLRKMERAALELMGEATRQDYISVGDPDVIGTMILPAIPDESALLAHGEYLPIRQKWMDYYLDQIGKLIPIYAEMTDTLMMPAASRDQATQLLDQMRPYFIDARTRYLALIKISKKIKTARNQQVAELSVQVHDDIAKMDKLRKDVFALLKSS